ncbi:MAG: TRZ/ATZ family hydrolase [Burkholderiaceae bacterium]
MPNVKTLLCPEWIATAEPLATDRSQSEVLKNHAVAIAEDGTIAAVIPDQEAFELFPEAARIDRPGHLLTPGFVNLHSHAAMTLLRGYADDLDLHSWLEERIWPAEARCVSDDFVFDGAMLGLHEMLVGGITSFNDMYFYPEATARAALSLGMRATLGIMLIDFPSTYGTGPDDYLNKGVRLRDTMRDEPLLSFAIAPHAPYTVSDESLVKALALAQELQLPIHMHIHETAFEVQDAHDKNGERPLARLARLGLLGPNLIAVHAVHLDPTEIELIARHGVSIAHCPHSNLKLGSGTAPTTELLDSGINLGIGTDGSASNNKLDLLQETRTAALLAKGVSRNPAAFNAHQALRAMTIGGATALGQQDRLGSIRAGKIADLTLIQLNTPALTPVFDPVSQLIYATDRSDVTDVWIAGNHVVHRQQLVDPASAAAFSGVVARIPVWQNEISDAGH